MAFLDCESFRYENCHHARSRFADTQETRFHAMNRSYMSSAVLLGGRFAGVQELRFQTAKRSDICCV